MAKLFARVISAAAFLQLVAATEKCRFKCLDSNNKVFCCETGQHDPNGWLDVNQRPGMCPMTRLQEASEPFGCYTDHNCFRHTDKCCFDMALEYKVCKPPVYYVDITSPDEEPIRVAIPSGKPAPKPKQPKPKPVQWPIYAPTYPHQSQRVPQPHQVPQVPQVPQDPYYYYRNRNPYQGSLA